MKRNNFTSNLNVKTLAGVAVWALAFMVPTVGRATVVFSNLAGSSPRYNISDGNLIGNDVVFGTNDAEGDTFLGTGVNFSNLQIALSCFGTGLCPDNITVALMADAGNQPGAAIESFTVSGASLGILGVNNALVSLNSVTHPLLGSGTRYWITVASDLNDILAWNLNSTGDASIEANSQDGGATWFSPSGFTPGAFEVDGTASGVPEPGTAGLLVGGGLLLGLFRRLRSRQTQ